MEEKNKPVNGNDYRYITCTDIGNDGDRRVVGIVHDVADKLKISSITSFHNKRYIMIVSRTNLFMIQKLASDNRCKIYYH